MPNAEPSLLERWLTRACIALPLAMLAANLVAWLRYGTDMPFIDDWRAYRDGNADSFALARLFQVVNNTISPIGFALDTVAQRWLDGNSIAYQFLSMLLVLGALLWLQWRLIGWAIPMAAVRAVAFAATIFMLQAGSYWGEQNLAYHQALPLVFLLGTSYVVLTCRSRMMAPAALCLCLLAGLSYISGAIAALTLGCVWILMSYAHGPDEPLSARVRVGGFVAAMAGLLTTSLQLYLTRVAPGSDPALRYELTWPDKPEFWVFLLGKVGRAVGRPFPALVVEFVFAVGVVFLLAASLFWLLGRLARRVGDSVEWRTAYVYLPLVLIVAGYLMLVALGRTSVRDPSIRSAWDVFQFAYFRFHFFWVTLLLPWTLALTVLAWSRKRGGRQDLVKRPIVILMAMLALAAVRGLFSVNEHYADNAQFRAKEIRCLAEQLGSREPIRCPSFDMPDWTPAYQYGRRIHASFIKYFPVVAQQPSSDVLMHWTSREAGASNHATLTLNDVHAAPDGWLLGGDDPQAVFHAHDGAGFSRCQVIELSVRLRTKREDTLQVFFLKLGEKIFTENNSLRKRISETLPGRYEELRFTLDSNEGFENRLRIDPGQAGTEFQLTQVDAACRLRMPGNE